MITMKDIAKKAGVSQATVSRVISGNPSVNPETKMKVMEWVRKLDYQPNIIAQSLVGNKSLLIGVIIPNISNPFFADVIKAIENEATKYGYSIILFNSDYNVEKEKKYMNILKSYNVDGVLVVPSGNNDKYFKSLNNTGLHLVAITRDVPGVSCVSISHYVGGQEVAKHLINMGYSKFVFIGVEVDEKFKGFKDQIESSGFNIEKDVIVVNDDTYRSDSEILKNFIYCNIEHNSIGIFALNDIEALIVMHILKEMRVEMPEKVALVGFDNTFISKEVSPTLSSVAQPIEEIGRQAIEILIDKICEKENIEERHVILEPRIVVRESTVKSIKY